MALISFWQTIYMALFVPTWHDTYVAFWINFRAQYSYGPLFIWYDTLKPISVACCMIPIRPQKAAAKLWLILYHGHIDIIPCKYKWAQEDHAN